MRTRPTTNRKNQKPTEPTEARNGTCCKVLLPRAVFWKEDDSCHFSLITDEFLVWRETEIDLKRVLFDFRKMNYCKLEIHSFCQQYM